MTSLGGPGVACSSMRVRRLAAGELSGEDRARTEAHVAACARCRERERELAEERARLEEDLPFEAFAAGVAERLAAERPAAPRPRRAFRAAGLALAAGLAAAVAVPVAVRLAARTGPDGAADGFRLKGGPALAVWVGAPDGARALAPGEPVPPGASLRVGLSAGTRRFAAVALVDADGVVVLHAGAASPGPLAGAFEWTGEGDGALVAVLDDRPVDGAALASRLARGGVAAAAPGAGAEVVVRPLRRATR